MQIRELHPASDPADLAAILPVAQAASSDAMADFPTFGGSRLAMDADDLYDSKGVVLAVFPDEQATVACAYALMRIELAGNPDLAYGNMWVAPESRRRGIGSALHAEALRVAAGFGRTRLLWESPASTNPEAFALRHGGKPVERVTRSVLDLRAVDRARFAALAEPSPANAEYELVRWVDRCPADLVDSFCRAMSAMQDAPTGDSGYQIAAFTPEKLAAYEEGSIVFGVRRHVLVALAPDGEVAGLTIFAAHPQEPEQLGIWDTAVVRAHRGHGLGLRIKAAGALWCLEAYPAARWLDTFNNAGNEPMLRVNRELGYQASEDWIKFEFPVGEGAADGPATRSA